MARCKVEQVRCDRCKRVELMPIREATDVMPALDLTMNGKTLVQYADLCEKCKAAIMRSIEDIKEWDREVKQQFGPTLDTNEAPPLSPAPTYSPPKPHSAAAAKR